jgi:hypothetical protein
MPPWIGGVKSLAPKKFSTTGKSALVRRELNFKHCGSPWNSQQMDCHFILVLESSRTRMKMEKTDRPFDGIDLEIKLLRNEGLSITSKEGMGRVAVAVHDFGAEQLYRPIIREEPTLVWTAQ